MGATRGARSSGSAARAVVLSGPARGSGLFVAWWTGTCCDDADPTAARWRRVGGPDARRHASPRRGVLTAMLFGWRRRFVDSAGVDLDAE